MCVCLFQLVFFELCFCALFFFVCKLVLKHGYGDTGKQIVPEKKKRKREKTEHIMHV